MQPPASTLSSVLTQAVCVRCQTPIDLAAAAITCGRCGQAYPRVGAIPALMPRPDDHLTLWRRQLDRVSVQARFTAAGLRDEADKPDLPELTGVRVRGLAQGVRDQMAEIAALVSPALGGPLTSDDTVRLPRGVVDYIHHLYRDWAWPPGAEDENQVALDAIVARAGAEPFGRTLVIGAGACRLAYDLHRRCAASETVVVDIDPFIFTIAQAVVKGQSVPLTESSVNVLRAEAAARRWTLRAPDGPLGGDVFHFILANGLEPPFLAGAFDTVVTPWFIDQVPTDLPAFLARVERLLRPAGRWINQGPLLFPPETSLTQRFSLDELLQVASAAGVPVESWDGASRSYLVSPLTGRGRVEWVLTCAARVRRT